MTSSQIIKENILFLSLEKSHYSRLKRRKGRKNKKVTRERYLFCSLIANLSILN